MGKNKKKLPNKATAASPRPTDDGGLQNGVSETANEPITNGQTDKNATSETTESDKEEHETISQKAPATSTDEASNDLTAKLADLALRLSERDAELAEKESLLKAHKDTDTQQKALEEAKLQVEEQNAKLSARIKELENTAHVSSAPNGSAHPQNDEVVQLQAQLKAVEQERDTNKASYDALLSKLGGMKSVFSKMKDAQTELEETKEVLNKLTEDKLSLTSEIDTLKKDALSKDLLVEKLTTESNDLNNECDKLSQSLTLLRRESQLANEGLQDDKYQLENEKSKLLKRVSEYKSELNELQLSFDEAQIENKNLTLIIDELKEKAKSSEDAVASVKAVVAHKEKQAQEKQSEFEAIQAQLEMQLKDLSELKATADAEIEALKSQLAEKSATIEELSKDQEKIKGLEADVHNKQLHIGKLRHEAIILNEHLKKSLTMLKQQLTSSDNTIDKELISNVILQFLQFPRGDTKKFESLQLISALLGWDPDRKMQAGLTHSSTPARSGNKDDGRQSFVSLWTDFLEKESS